MLLCARPGTPPRPSQRDRFPGQATVRAPSVLTLAQDEEQAPAPTTSARLLRAVQASASPITSPVVLLSLIDSSRSDEGAPASYGRA